MKKIIAVFLLVLCCGCQKNTYQGETIMMTWKQGYEKIQQKDDFLLLFTQSGCDSCKQFQAIKSSYLKTHKETIYEINLAQEHDTKQIQSFFLQLTQTPTLYYIEDGNVVSVLEKPEDKTMEELAKWIHTNVKNL